MNASRSPAAPTDLELSMIVPTYNERERLEDFVRTVCRVLGESRLESEIVIVDDHSPDGTGELADSLSQDLPVVVLHRAGKLGLGSAVMDGFAAARGRLLGVMDADLSHPPASIPALVAALLESGADVAVGSRYVPGGGTLDWPWSRALMSRVACMAARPLTPVRDGASGFFVLRRGVVDAVEIQATGFKICLELLVRGAVRSVVEVPYVFSERAAGQSKMNHREALGYLAQLWQLFWWQRRFRRLRPVYRRVTPEEAARLGSRA